MIYLCRAKSDGCGRLWSLWPTHRKVRRAPWKICPDCRTNGPKSQRKVTQ